MNLRERIAKLNLLQRTTRFKVIASVLVVVLAIVAYAAWWTVLHAPSAESPAALEGPVATVPAVPPQTGPPDTPQGDGVQALADEDEFGARLDPNAVLRELGSRDGSLGVAVGVAAAVGLSLLVIWLGAGLTYLAIGLLAAAVVGPLKLFAYTDQLGSIAAGVAILAATFTICIETARTALSGNHPVFAIARTVVAEAVRMKISLVFILILIAWLASLPWLLDDAQPLRFRVQTFLRNGTSGAFWSLALLTMFFAVATVSFEQRDKVIWQTIVKPVSAWQYIAGKWLGIMAVNAALLGVSAAGVFLFTEYLRGQTANGEVVPYVNADGSGYPTIDRLILEARVLTARESREPTLQPVPVEDIRSAVDARVNEAIRTDHESADAERAAMRRALLPAIMDQLGALRTSIAPFDVKEYEFHGLDRARDLGRPVTFRYKVQAGANDPTEVVAMLLEFVDTRTNDFVHISIDSPLNVSQSVDLRSSVIGPDGVLRVRVYNGDPIRSKPNNITLRFPPDGLEVLYVRSSYEANFIRVTAALWVKLGFIAAAGIFGATFLSFPVACMLAFLVLFAAETSGFLKGSLEIYTSVDQQGNVEPFKLIVRAIAIPITKVFAGYRELNSTGRLVDGKLLSWSDFTGAGMLIMSLITVILGSAVAIFRKRELATYSGH